VLRSGPTDVQEDRVKAPVVLFYRPEGMLRHEVALQVGCMSKYCLPYPVNLGV
jgi:hypothetical protein